MPGGWSQVQQDIWRDAPFLALSSDAKALFIYSFTHSPESSITGLSEVSERALGRVLGDRQLVEPVLEELGAKPFVKYDWDAELLWCVNRMKHAHSKSPKWLKGARSIVERMPPSPIIDQFKRRYGDLLRDGNA